MGLSFDEKFGKDFVRDVPAGPGVYRVYNVREELVYIGKAKNLKRRISQYRNAKRTRKDRKMRKIVGDARRWEWELCGSNHEAELLETRLIQEHRPKWNVVGAFSFLYPLIGVHLHEGELALCLTTVPDEVGKAMEAGESAFRFYGAYRSRGICRDAFFALGRLFQYVGHPSSRSRTLGEKAIRYTVVLQYRGLGEPWKGKLERFLMGHSSEFLEELALALLDNAGARARASEVEEDLKSVRLFFRHEASRLWIMCRALGLADECARGPIPQRERDVIVLKYRELKANGISRGQGLQDRQLCDA